MGEELNQIKQYFINEYRKNGGEDDLTARTIPEIMGLVEKQKEIHELHDQLFKAKNNSESRVGATIIKPVDKARENAELARQAAYFINNTVNYMDPPIDMRVMDDESFAKDNNLGKFYDLAGEGVILRDNAGRCDAGGRTKYKGGFDIEW